MKSIKRIAYTITDSGCDGRAPTTIMQAFWFEQARDDFLAADKNKAYRGTGEMIVDPEKTRRQALAKLSGIDKLVLEIK